MKVSLRTVKYYTGGELNLDNVDELVQKIGAQLGAVEEVIDYSARYDGVVVAKVVKSEKHPNADKLSVCEIDVGTMETVQVVCGAPNVREGLIVAWIPPGTIVPSTYDKDSFVLEAREIRGVVSNGMLASPSELAISGDHEGILEILSEVVGEDNTKPGTLFKNLYGLSDTVIDIENKMFTHRPDCFGVLGVAREISGIYQHKFKSPDWYLDKPVFTPANELPLKIVNETPELVPRFMAVAMSNVTIEPSPVWVQALLTRIGVKPINNAVDITNHLAYVTGQPLHVYDYDKVKQLSGDVPTLTARHPKKGETITLLNGKAIEPRDEAIMIATDKTLVGIGGVMGGIDTEVDENTKNIIIECVNFDMYSIRRTSMAHGLFTDAVTRNNKGQSPLQNDVVLAQAMEMMRQHSGAKQASDVIDETHNLKNSQEIEVSPIFINTRLGSELSGDEITNLLLNVEFKVDNKGDSLKITAPFWRTDIEIEEDIVEEVGRLYGYEKLPKILPKKSVAPALIDPKITTKKRIRTNLSSLGLNEVLTYSFIPEDLIKKAGQDSEIAFKINNALSPELQYYRLSLTPNLLNHVHVNIKNNYEKFGLFEIGVVHSKTEIGEDDVPSEFGRVAVVIADKNAKNAPFYGARTYINQLGISGVKFVKYNDDLVNSHKLMAQMFAPYDSERCVFLTNQDGHPVGVLGEFKASVIKSFKLPNYCAGFELFLSAFKNTGNDYLSLSRYPSISQDVCLEVDAKLPFSELNNATDDAVNNLIPEDCSATLNLIDIFADEKMTSKKRITFRINLSSYERTLTEDVIAKLVSNSVQVLSEKLDAKQI